MKKLLLIQSRVRPDLVATEREEYARGLAGAATELSFLSSLDEGQPWETPERILAGYHGCIIGGSGEFDLDGGREAEDPARRSARTIRGRLEPLVSYAFAHHTPLLGVCFGHQIIADLLEGGVQRDENQKKVGSHEVSRTEEGRRDALFADLPDTFVSQYGHKDSVTSLPRGAVLLARGRSCNFSALRYGEKAYTVQFHPELSAQDVLKRLRSTPGYLPEGIDPSSIVRESAEASRILPLFALRIA